MATSSSSAGFLAPITSPVDDQALEDVLQATIVGITGLAGQWVRPRWQPEPPNQPPLDQNWVAFGIIRRVYDSFMYKGHDPDGDSGNGVDLVECDESLQVLHSFYGPNSNSLCTRFRAGLDVDQNRDALRANGILLTEVQDAINLPALLKEKWVLRIDATVIYRRRHIHSFPIRNLVSGQAGIDNERYLTPIVIPNP